MGTGSTDTFEKHFGDAVGTWDKAVELRKFDTLPLKLAKLSLTKFQLPIANNRFQSGDGLVDRSHLRSRPSDRLKVLLWAYATWRALAPIASYPSDLIVAP
jgi:hypothetical protein